MRDINKSDFKFALKVLKIKYIIKLLINLKFMLQALDSLFFDKPIGAPIRSSSLARMKLIECFKFFFRFTGASRIEASSVTHSPFLCARISDLAKGYPVHFGPTAEETYLLSWIS